MAVFTKVNPGDPIQAHQLDQVIDALIGTAGQGVALAVTAVNDATNYALTVQNDESGNSRALNVIKSDGTLLIRADASGVSLGAPLNLTAGSVQTAALADQGVTNQKLGPDTARANLLTNGGFEIWQRGNGPYTAVQYTADRWVTGLGASATISVTRVTGNGGLGYALQAVYTHAGTASSISQDLQTSDNPVLPGRTVSLSADINASAAGAVTLRILTNGTGSISVSSAAHPGGSVWQRLTVTGTTNVATTDVQIGIVLNASCTVQVDNAMLVVGAVPTNYVPMTLADEFARCFRYYEFSGLSAEIMCTSWSGAIGEGLGVGVPWRVQKAVTPTVTRVGSLSVTNTSGGAQPIIASSGVLGMQIYQTSAAVGHFQFGSSNAGYYTVEANP